ncbi:MAG: hypothetical protein WKF65_04905 [Gaiellaceae bacterium]
MPFKQPTDPVFPTAKGGRDCRQNVRRRLLVKAVERANTQLVKEGIEPNSEVGLHGLRRTFATLRCAIGDDRPTPPPSWATPTRRSRCGSTPASRSGGSA